MNSVSESLRSSRSIFSIFQQKLDDETSRLQGQIQGVSDLKKLSTKQKGDFFELVCQQYLLYIYDCDIVYTSRNLPGQLRRELNVSPQDLGIDFIAVRGEEYYAVQCKWRKPARFTIVPGTRIRTNIVPWADLATFYALCERTGPWNRRIVMTNAVGIRRVGGKRAEDFSICHGSFEKLKVADWYLMFEIEGNRLSEDIDEEKLTLEQLRELRIVKFTQ